MRALLALPILMLSACSAQAEDACVGEIELLMKERDSFVATQMEALKVLHDHASPPKGTPPSPEELRLYSDFMTALEATNNRIAVRIRDCPAMGRKALEGVDPATDAVPLVKMPDENSKEPDE